MRRVTMTGGCCALALSLSTTTHADTIITSFEFTDQSGLFTLGAAPERGVFEDGLAQTVFKPGLYHTGMNAWMIAPGDTGEITFETPLESLTLWFRQQFPDNDATLTVTDTTGAIMHMQAGTTTYEEIVLAMPAEGPYIQKVRLENAGAEGWAVIDDLTACITLNSMPGIVDPLPGDLGTSPFHVALTEVAGGLASPIWGGPAPNDDARLYVIDQAGQLVRVNLGDGATTIVLDVADQLVPLGVFGPETFDERGLLGFAFHPDFASNGRLYTYQSEPVDGPADFSTMPEGEVADHQSVVAEWQATDPADPDWTVMPASKRTLLRVDQPQFNHNAGAMLFDDAGRLYIAFGDGGGADDLDGQPFLGGEIIGHGDGNGQNPLNPLGSLLRIDPLGSNSANGEYGIPRDNPFVGDADAIDETYAYGFRNPFRMSRDDVTGDILIADVGQNDIEEINTLVAGGNYGWREKEGSFFFLPNGVQPGYVLDVDLVGLTGLTDPIAEYDHDEGLAIIGGFVYRGDTLPGLEGRYVFGDWSSGFLANNGRLLHLDDEGEISEFVLTNGAPNLGMSLQGFAQDASGEIYVLANTTGTPFGETGVVLRIGPIPGDLNADGVVGADDLAGLLAAWGPCVPACPADLDGDGVVGPGDLAILLANWG